MEIEKLRALNEQQKALYEQEIVGLKEDRRAREEEMRIKFVDRTSFPRNSSSARPSGAESETHPTDGEAQLRCDQEQDTETDCNVDYLDQKHTSQNNERQVHEENELLRLENNHLREAAKNVQTKAQQESSTIEVECEKRSGEVLGKFRQQSQVQEENLQIIKARCGTTCRNNTFDCSRSTLQRSGLWKTVWPT